MAKVRVTFTIEKEIVEKLEKVCRNMRVKKSPFVETTLGDALSIYDSLFDGQEDLSLSRAFKVIASKIEEMEKNDESKKGSEC